MNLELTLSCPLYDSFRVRQVAGMFDVPLEAKLAERITVQLPDTDEDWRIGAIVGPSGSGKSSVARAAYGDCLYEPGRWPEDAAVIDGFGDLSTKQIAHALTAVGLGSPPAWIKPYRVLSGGERFRCDLARALLEGAPVVAFDEFTSVVDRTVAKFASAAVAKAIRTGKLAAKFVAVTCHYDVLDWLAPDWSLDMASGVLHRRRLRRPDIALEIFRCRRAVWRAFARHHYLTGDLAPAARCYVALWQGEPVAFCGLLNAIGRRGVRRVSRLVTLPDYQGLGVGGRFLASIGELNRDEGYRTTITTGHPAMIAHLKRSPVWRIRRLKKTGSHFGAFGRKKGVKRTSQGRTVVSAEYVGPATAHHA